MAFAEHKQVLTL